jgi:hypothetical protein
VSTDVESTVTAVESTVVVVVVSTFLQLTVAKAIMANAKNTFFIFVLFVN